MSGKPSKGKASSSRPAVLSQVSTPLSFFVLSLLIIEATLTIVLTCSRLPEEAVLTGFFWMIGIFVSVLIVVSLFTAISPRNLLYGKEEHLAPELEPSALKDQIEDLIFQNVKDDCLKNPSKDGN